jgi:hypothetical protein
METKYQVKLGNNNHQPWKQYSREDLEYSARQVGFREGFIEALSDQELFERVIAESCRQMEKEK